MALNAHQLAGWDLPRMHVPRLAVHLPDWLSNLMEKVKREDVCVASPPISAGERVLLSMFDERRCPVVATDRALYQQNVFSRAVDDEGWSRLPWELVSRVKWHEDDHALTLTGLVPTIPPAVLAIRDGKGIALLARERVEWTSVIQTRVDLAEHGSLRVLARQTPGTGHLVWVVSLDEGIDAHAPAVQGAVQAALARLRASLGLPSLRAESSALGLRSERDVAPATASPSSATASGRARTPPGTRADTYGAVAS